MPSGLVIEPPQVKKKLVDAEESPAKIISVAKPITRMNLKERIFEHEASCKKKQLTGLPVRLSNSSKESKKDMNAATLKSAEVILKP